jgi:hypothetical protein
MTIQEARTKGITGDEIAVCSCLFPIPFGHWHGDYHALGLTIPAPYTIPDTVIHCTHGSIDCITSDGKVCARTLVWNDNWVPAHPKEGSTRCGTVTMIDQEVVAGAMERLGRKLAFFIQLRIWDREKEYGNYSESERNFFLLDQGE